MKPYKPTLTGVTAGFPSQVYTPEDIKDPGEYEHSESLTEIEAPYLYRLDMLPARFPVPEVTVDGSPRVVVPYSPAAPPSTGQVAISFDMPLIQFAADDASGTSFEVDYTGLGSMPIAQILNQMQVEIAASQTAVNGRQAADEDLTALAGLAATGLIARTGTGTAAVRTITGSGSDITVTNGNGVSGNPTVAVGSNIPKKNTANTFTQKQTFSGGIVNPLKGFSLLTAGATSLAVSAPAIASTTDMVLVGYSGSNSGGSAPFVTDITPGVGFTIRVTTSPASDRNILWMIFHG